MVHWILIQQRPHRERWRSRGLFREEENRRLGIVGQFHEILRIVRSGRSCEGFKLQVPEELSPSHIGKSGIAGQESHAL